MNLEYIKNRINNEYCLYTFNKLTDESLSEECLNTQSTKTEIEEFKSMIKKVLKNKQFSLS